MTQKIIAGYHLLMILSAVDGKVSSKEDKVIRRYLDEHFTPQADLDAECELLMKMDESDYAIQFNNSDWSDQATATDFVSALNGTATYLESVGDGNVIAFETGEKSLSFDGKKLDVKSHFDDGSTIAINSYSASSGIKKADGSYSYDPLPNGDYSVNNGRYRGKVEGKGGFYRDGIAFTFDVNPNFTTANGQPMRRTELRIHPDGNRLGSAGCVALACDRNTLQGFYNDMKSYIGNKGSIGLKVADPANPNVSFNRHANDKKKSGE